MAIQEFPNQEKLNRAFNIYRYYMREFIYEQLTVRYDTHTAIKDAIVGSLGANQKENFNRNLRGNSDDLKATIAIAHFSPIVTMHWDAIFAEKFDNRKVIIQKGNRRDSWKDGHLGYVSEFWSASYQYHNLVTDIAGYRLEQIILRIRDVLHLIGEREAGDAVGAILTQENMEQGIDQLAAERDAAIKDSASAAREAEQAVEKAARADERVRRVAEIANMNSSQNRELTGKLTALTREFSQLSAERDAAIKERESAALALEQEKKRTDEHERRIRDLEDKFKQAFP